MPRGDRTGPLGQGPMTGRRLGDCAGNENTGWFGRGFGRSFGLGRGIGRGFGFGSGYSNVPYDRKSEQSWLETAITGLKNQLKSLEQRREEMDK